MLIPNRMGANIGKRASPNSAVADSQDVPRRNFDGRGSSGRISLGMSAYFFDYCDVSEVRGVDKYEGGFIARIKIIAKDD